MQEARSAQAYGTVKNGLGCAVAVIFNLDLRKFGRQIGNRIRGLQQLFQVPRAPESAII